MKKISFILIIFFLLGQNIAEPSDTFNWEAYQKAIKEVDEDKTRTRHVKEKVKAFLRFKYYDDKNSKLELANRKRGNNEIWGLIGKKDYTAALQKIEDPETREFLYLWDLLILPRIIRLKMETDVPTPKDKINALELEIKKLKLEILQLELDLGNIKDKELELIDSRRQRDISGIELRLLDLEERLNKP